MAKKKDKPNQVEVQVGNVDVLTVSFLSSINKTLALILEELQSGRQSK